jgi:hypothetical protein
MTIKELNMAQFAAWKAYEKALRAYDLAYQTLQDAQKQASFWTQRAALRDDLYTAFANALRARDEAFHAYQVAQDAHRNAWEDDALARAMDTSERTQRDD